MRRAVVGGAGLVAVVGVVLLVEDPVDRSATPTTSAAPGAASATPSSAPITVEEFCTRFRTTAESTMLFQDGSTDASSLRASAQEMQGLLARAPVPDDARAGLSYTLGLLAEMDDGTTAEDLAAADADATIDESAAAQAAATWLVETCL